VLLPRLQALTSSDDIHRNLRGIADRSLAPAPVSQPSGQFDRLRWESPTSASLPAASGFPPILPRTEDNSRRTCGSRVCTSCLLADPHTRPDLPCPLRLHLAWTSLVCMLPKRVVSKYCTILTDSSAPSLRLANLSYWMS